LRGTRLIRSRFILMEFVRIAKKRVTDYNQTLGHKNL
jgi:hypothetical protein